MLRSEVRVCVCVCVFACVWREIYGVYHRPLMHSHRLYECLLFEDIIVYCCDEGNLQTRPLGASHYQPAGAALLHFLPVTWPAFPIRTRCGGQSVVCVCLCVLCNMIRSRRSVSPRRLIYVQCENLSGSRRKHKKLSEENMKYIYFFYNFWTIPKSSVDITKRRNIKHYRECLEDDPETKRKVIVIIRTCRESFHGSLDLWPFAHLSSK